MPSCIFVTDLHGHPDRYEKLFRLVRDERPAAVFMGGDLLPNGVAALSSLNPSHKDFVNDFLVASFLDLKEDLAEAYPRVFLILGNDDPRFAEAPILDAASNGIWEYVHNRRVEFDSFSVYGYAYIPPSPFLLKDWERYDVSRYIDPGCISPEEGRRSVPVPEREQKYATIRKDLENLVQDDNLDQAIFLFHSPPHKTNLDRAALDGKMIDHVPLDVHIGSIAIRELIENRQPLMTLHGHVHESTNLTGQWQEKIGRTHAISAAHDGDELAVVRFDPSQPDHASRDLL